MKGEGKHEHFCFAGQPAACKGYFPDDVLPCVCGAEGDAVTALSLVAVSRQGPKGGMNMGKRDIGNHSRHSPERDAEGNRRKGSGLSAWSCRRRLCRPHLAWRQ